jgi:hypothetical protein
MIDNGKSKILASLRKITQDYTRKGIPLSLTMHVPGLGEIVCSKVYRAIRGKRIACLGTVRNSTVIVKLYFSKYKSRRNWKHSDRGCRAFVDREIPAPRILFSGYLPEYGFYAMVFEYLTEALRIDSALEACSESDQREKVLDILMACIASLHEHGILQNDLHLGNFMISGECIYALDGDQVTTQRRPIGRKRSFRNLAKLLANIPPAYISNIENRIISYVNKRGWDISHAEIRKVKEEIRRFRGNILSEYLRKIFRRRDPFVTHSDLRFYSVHDRHQFDVEFDDIIEALKKSSFEKESYASGYYLALIGDKNLLVWSSRGYGPRILRRFWSASRIWKNALMLRRIGVETPIPVTLVARCRNIFRWDCAVFFKSVEGMNLKDFFHSENVASDIKGCIAEALADAYTRMEAFGITAGRINPEGIIISGLKVVFHDLEIFNRPAFSIWSTQEGRLERFLSYFAHIPGLTELLTEHLKNRGITKVQRS